MQKLKLIFTLFLILFGFYFFVAPVKIFAHFVKSSGTIGTLLHMDPEDDPIAGSSSNIILEFKDTDNKFDLTNCDCKLVIFENDREINSSDLTPVSENEKLSSVTAFTFPEKNIYKLRITGSPKSGVQFSKFEISYDVRVARTAETNGNIPTQTSWLSGHLIHLIGGGVIIIFFIIALIIQNKNKKGV